MNSGQEVIQAYTEYIQVKAILSGMLEITLEQKTLETSKGL